MSRSHKSTGTSLPNPIARFFNFSGSKGVLQYWDGEQTVDVTDIELALMDIRSCVTGWNDKLQARIWSNKVKSVNKDELTVKAGNTKLVTGMYSKIKDEINKLGGKFATVVYGLANFNGETNVPVAIELSGSSVGPWIDYVEKCGGQFSMYNQLIKMSADPETKKKGAIKFRVPQFDTAELSPEMAAEADRIDREALQPYFNSLVRSDSSEPTEAVPFA